MSQSQSQPTQTGTICTEQQALIGGLVASLAAVVLAVLAVRQILGILGDLIWFTLSLVALAALVQYWTVQSRKGDLTNQKVVVAVASVLVGLVLFFYSIYSVLSLGFQLIWIGILVWSVGAVASFWLTRSHKGGLTWGKVALNAAWPVSPAGRIYANIKRRRQTTTNQA